MAQRDGATLGYVVVDDVIGKFELITYAVAHRQRRRGSAGRSAVVPREPRLRDSAARLAPAVRRQGLDGAAARRRRHRQHQRRHAELQPRDRRRQAHRRDDRPGASVAGHWHEPRQQKQSQWCGAPSRCSARWSKWACGAAVAGRGRACLPPATSPSMPSRRCSAACRASSPTATSRASTRLRPVAASTCQADTAHRAVRPRSSCSTTSDGVFDVTLGSAPAGWRC